MKVKSFGVFKDPDTGVETDVDSFELSTSKNLIVKVIEILIL